MPSAPSLFIATPAADGIALAPYVASLAATVARLAGGGIGVTYRIRDGTDLIRQRNLLTAEFLASGCTHLLFVDSDMTFPADLAEKLLGYRKPLIGVVYPKRSLDLARLKELAAFRPYEDALALAHSWNVHVLDGTVALQNGICRVAALPGGFLLIERACLEELAQRSDVPSLPGSDGRAPVRAYFREEREGPKVFDLDYSFCRRWRDLGGEVWAYPAADVRHVGDASATLPFGTLLRSLQPPADAGAAGSPAAPVLPSP